MLPALGVFGISGVGKTTLIRRYLAQRHGVIATSGGRLLQEIKGQPGEELRKSAGANVEDSQAGLLQAFRLFRHTNADQRVIFDGHTIIDSDAGIAEIPAHVIVGLALDAIIFIRDAPEGIAARRGLDTARQRPARSAETLKQHQELARSLAEKYAKQAGIPFTDVIAGDLPVFEQVANRNLQLTKS